MYCVMRASVPSLHNVYRRYDYYCTELCLVLLLQNQRHINPSRELSMDEGMLAFRGRVGFRQYIRGKHLGDKGICAVRKSNRIHWHKSKMTTDSWKRVCVRTWG